MTVCATCGRGLSEHDTDIGFQLPDVVWALSEADRGARTISNADLCVLDGTRHFLRAIAYLPIVGGPDRFGWGLWAEVSQDVFDRYFDLYETDATGEPPAQGRLANSPAPYESALGHPVAIIHFGLSSNRPTLLLKQSKHQLWVDQSSGITTDRLHQLVAPYR